MTTLPFDFDIFLRSGSSTQPEIAALRHGSSSCVEVRAQDRREQPGPDDVVRLRAQVHREDRREQLRRPRPRGRRSAASARRSPTCPSRRGRRRTRRAARAGRPRSRRARRSRDRPGSCSSRAGDRLLVEDGAVAVERVPDRERHAEEALAADAPVAGQAVAPSPRSARACTAGASAARARARSARSRCSIVRMNHWRLVMISTGRSPFSKNFTARVDRLRLADQLARLARAARRSAGAPG